MNRCMVELISGQNPGLTPDIMSRLLTLTKFLDIPMECWNTEMKNLFKECVDSLCALSKW